MDQTLRTHLQRIVTLGLALAFVVLGWAGVADLPWWRALGVTPQQWWHLVPLALMAAPMLLRVRRPGVALAVGGACVLADLAIGVNPGIFLCLSDLIYNVGIRGDRYVRRVAGIALAAVPVMCAAAAIAAGWEAGQVSSVAVTVGAVLLMPLWWAIEVRRGYPIWQESDVRSQLESERHAALLRAQTRIRRDAVEAERRTMARELHDAVASQVSAIALTSGAALHAPPDDVRDRAALRAINGSSIHALDQLREMVQLLRRDARAASAATDGGGEGDHAIAELLSDTSWEHVLAQARAHGLEITVEGTPPDELATTLRHVVVRVLQEALANALTHGDGRARVDLRRQRRSVVLCVTSGLEDPRRPDSHGPSLGAGTGLVVMRERVSLVGGDLRAGVEDGSWVVVAELPVTGHRETEVAT